MSRSRSASPPRQSERSLLLTFEGGRRLTKHYLLKPGDYTNAELTMLYDWADSKDIFNDYVIDEEDELFNPNDLEAGDMRPTTLEEAAPHLRLWDKLVKRPEILQGTIINEPVQYLRISAFD